MWTLKKTFQFKEGRVAYDVKGEGPPLVLVHGTPTSSYIWRRFVNELSREWTVYYYDLIGYGLSEKRQGQDVSLATQTELLYELIRHWGLHMPTIVGHDFGGAITLRTHLLRNQPFRRIALMDPVALSPWGTEFARLVSKHTEAFERLPEPMHEAMLAVYLRSAFYRPIGEEELLAYMNPWVGPEGQCAFYRQMSFFDEKYTDEFRDLLPSIDIPVCILWGEKDTWIPIDRGLELQQRIPNSEMNPIPYAGHFLQQDNPEATLRCLRQFLKSALDAD